MGVGKYNVTANSGIDPGAQDFSGPQFRYTQPVTPPPGVSANPFDQTAINWQMAQKYAQERAQENQNIQKLYGQAYNNWTLNGSRGTAPNQPAMYETDPNKLFSYFNSSQPGVLLQGGRVVDNRQSQATVDPLQWMFDQGTPGKAPVPAGGAPAAPAQPASAPAVPGAVPPAPAPSAWNTGLTPAQQEANIRNIQGGPQFPNTGTGDFGANLTPAQRVPQGPLPASAAPPGTPSPAPSPATEVVTGQDPGSISTSAAAPSPPPAPAGVPPDQWFQFMQWQSQQRNAPGTRYSGGSGGYAAPPPAPPPYETQPNAGTGDVPVPAATSRAPAAGGRPGTEPVSPYVAPQAANNSAPQPQFSMRNRGTQWTGNRRGY